MNELHLFAGAGGGILAGQLLGHRCVCAVEWEPYAQAVLVARQNDGTFPSFPIWDDVQTFDGRPWNGVVDVVAGGFPCQDISVAGGGSGLDGKRSGMWHHMARIIGEVRPSYAFIENSPALVNRGLDRVLSDLAAIGFDARWGVLSAADVGAHHKRERIWIVAHAQCQSDRSQVNGGETFREKAIRPTGGACRSSSSSRADAMGHAQRFGRKTGGHDHGEHDRAVACADGEHSEILADSDSDSVQGLESESQQSCDGRQAGLFGGARGLQPWPADPADAPKSGVGRVANGVANRAHRIKATGNGQVPRVAATAWELLK